MTGGPAFSRRAAASSWLSVFVICCMGTVARSEAGADDLQFTVGAKTWANEWTSWEPVGTGHNTIRVLESIAADTHWAVIPQASLRYQNWLVSASYFANTDYSLGGSIEPSTGQLTALKAARKEVDGNVGYYLLPSLALTLGYKQITQNFGTNSYEWKGPTVGVAGGASLHGALALYDTFAYGRLRLTASAPDDAGGNHFNADYILGELGLSYGINTPLSHLSFSVTAGYRAQFVGTRKFALSTGFGGYRYVDLHDFTYGPAISVLARF
jgi:hypothetical protein